MRASYQISCSYFFGCLNPGGGLLYKTEGDARRLALGCKLQILVSRVFGMESYYISLLIQVSLSTADKEIYKNWPGTDHTEIFLKGQFKLEPHPH